MFFLRTISQKLNVRLLYVKSKELHLRILIKLKNNIFFFNKISF